MVGSAFFILCLNRCVAAAPADQKHAINAPLLVFREIHNVGQDREAAIRSSETMSGLSAQQTLGSMSAKVRSACQELKSKVLFVLWFV